LTAWVFEIAAVSAEQVALLPQCAECGEDFAELHPVTAIKFISGCGA
jgi:hypothetical protein